MIDLGIVKPGSTIYIPWGSFAAGTGAPSAMTNLAVGDIKIYKDGGTTERASTTGFTLLDTDGQDFDGLTGINGVSIDLSSDATAGFYAAGSRYFVVIGDVTIDGQTVRFVAATFMIGLPGAVLNTTIATLSSQTSFTLTSGPAEDDALNGCVLYIHDVASAVQGGFAFVSDYTGSTKTVTLLAGTTYTAAASDNVMVLPPANVAAWNATRVPAEHTAGYPIATIKDGTGTGEIDTTAGAIATVNSLASNAIAAASIATGAITAAKFAAGAIDAAAIADGAIDAAALASDTGQKPVHNGTAQAGSSTTITLASGASSTDDIYKGSVVTITSGTGAGQSRQIASYVGSTKVATLSHANAAWVVTPDGTSVYVIVPQDFLSLMVAIAFRALQTTAEDIAARLPGSLVGGRMDSSVGAMAAGTLTATAIAADAITAAKVAADVAAEIADAVLDEDMTAHQTQGSLGQAIGDPVADTNTIFKAVVTDATGATVGVDVGTMSAVVDGIDEKLPDALVGGKIDANVGAINNAATSAARLAESAQAIVMGSADTGASTTSVPCKTLDPGANVTDQFKGRAIIFSQATSQAALRGQAREITASSTTGGAANCTLTVAALTTAPSVDAIFTIV